DAVERRGQLHQHAFARALVPLPAVDARHHARRVGGVQSVAGAHGTDRRAGAAPVRCGRPSGRRARGGGGDGGGCRRSRLQWRHGRRCPALPAPDRTQEMGRVMLERRAALATLLAERGDTLVVSGLGSTTWDLASLGDDDRNFYLWGAMGGAAMLGLGLALARPERRVIVVTGDGEMLMGLGSLATIGIQQPRNLAVIVFDNGAYGETGMQPSHTQGGVDLIGVARACGIATCLDVRDENALANLALRVQNLCETLFARVQIAADEPPRVLPLRDGIALKNRFRAAVGINP